MSRLTRWLRRLPGHVLMRPFLGLIPALLAVATARADADGPDYYRVSGIAVGGSLAIRSGPGVEHSRIGELPAGTDGLRNLGCQGGLTFAEWEKATPAEREAGRKRRWCRIESRGVTGWVAGWFLTEGEAPASPAGPVGAGQGPTFDCARATHDVERLICGDAELAALDRRMDSTYRAAVAVLAKVADKTAAQRSLRATQAGWVGGRNDCWKATDKRQCTKDSYLRREAELVAKYMLMPGSKPVFYVCAGNPANEIAATFFKSELPSVRLERGDTVKVGVATPAASGTRYDADFGVSFWIKGDEVAVEWPQGNTFTCVVRK
ncbi:MAG: MliC family protein [Alphaproteobacteria bacterium]|nr:MliC family protein [Alphaproteobacteria bacterium]